MSDITVSNLQAGALPEDMIHCVGIQVMVEHPSASVPTSRTGSISTSFCQMPLARTNPLVQ